MPTAAQRAVRDEVVIQSLTILVILLGAFIAISLIVSLSITRPLRAIENMMRRLASGDDGAEVPGTGRRDEIGEMARAVQVFQTGLVERARLAVEQLTAQEARDRRARALEVLIDGFQCAILPSSYKPDNGNAGPGSMADPIDPAREFLSS